MRGSAGRIMIRPGQAIMIAWLTTAHAPLWLIKPAHERAPSEENAANCTKISSLVLRVGSRPAEPISRSRGPRTEQLLASPRAAQY